MGQRLADLLPPDRADGVAASLRLEAVYRGGEPQAMIELPIHHRERGMTYWNVTSSPLPGGSARVTGVLVAAVEVTRQVVARQREQEAAEMAQDLIGKMLTLHAVAGGRESAGNRPSRVLAGIPGGRLPCLTRAGHLCTGPHYAELEVVVCRGLRGDYTPRIRVGEGLAGRVGQTGQGLIVDDYRAYPFRTAIYDDEDFSAVIAVPLIHRGQVVGVLDVLDDAERRAFTDDDLWLLDLFAAQAAQAIENARTYVELERAYRKQRDLDDKDDFIAAASTSAYTFNGCARLPGSAARLSHPTRRATGEGIPAEGIGVRSGALRDCRATAPDLATGYRASRDAHRTGAAGNSGRGGAPLLQRTGASAGKSLRPPCRDTGESLCRRGPGPIQRSPG